MVLAKDKRSSLRPAETSNYSLPRSIYNNIQTSFVVSYAKTRASVATLKKPITKTSKQLRNHKIH